MNQESVKVLIAFSDTHLGLRAGRRLWFFKNTVTHQPNNVDQFVKWLIKLESSGSEDVIIGDELGRSHRKRLVAPEKLVLNGDIFELWDASDRAVEFASHSVLEALSRLECDKLYLVGNHDFAMQEIAEKELSKGEIESGSYPWGISPLRIIRDTYPVAKEGSIITVLVGDHHYLLLHGHQFSQGFRITPWQIVSYLRDGAEAFRLYSWIIVAFWAIWVISLLIMPLLSFGIPEVIHYAVTGMLSVLAFPRVFVSVARPIWNKIKGHRYKRRDAARGFVDWWREFLDDKSINQERIHIIYGHTHLIDLITKDELERLTGTKIEGPDLVLINHPAWVKDLKPKYENVLQDAFVYVDAEGFEFFGWDWCAQRPFHIPKLVVQKRVSYQKIDAQTADWLIQLGWPSPLVDEWRKALKL